MNNFCLLYSRVSVIRGQVVTPQGLGMIGIRVSVDKDARFGFTLTRAGGWWVFMTFMIFFFPFMSPTDCRVSLNYSILSFYHLNAFENVFHIFFIYIHPLGSICLYKYCSHHLMRMFQAWSGKLLFYHLIQVANKCEALTHTRILDIIPIHFFKRFKSEIINVMSCLCDEKALLHLENLQLPFRSRNFISVRISPVYFRLQMLPC